MAAQITGQEHWHINADEPAFYDYRLGNKSPAQKGMNLGTPFRSSDHDPLLAGITLSIPDLDYVAWQGRQVWSRGAGMGAEDDPDGDGLVNLMEFAMNLNPGQPSRGMEPKVSVSAGRCLFEFRRHRQAKGVTWVPEWTQDLIEWHAMPSVESGGMLDARTELMRAVLSTQGLPRVLLRLRIVLNN